MTAVCNSLTVEERELKNELECSICLDILKKPKLLACTHTFCLECLENLLEEEEGDENGTKEIICPICRAVTKIQENSASSLYPNYIVQNSIKKLQDAKHGDSCMKCGDCVKSRTADTFCHDCKLAMCTNCARHHLKSKLSPHHHMENIGSVKPKKLHNTYQYCTAHNEFLKYFCKECSVIVCHKCIFNNIHSTHERGFIEEVLDDKKEKINALVIEGKEAVVTVNAFLEKADQSLAEALEQKEKSVNVIEDAFNSIIQPLNEKKDELMSKVNDPYNKSFKSIEQAKQKGKILNDMLQYAVKLIESEECENLEALSGVVKQLTENLSECDVKEGEKVKKNIVPKYNVHGSHKRKKDANLNIIYLATDGTYYYKDENGEYFRGFQDGIYYDEVKATGHYQFFEKKLLSNSKVGNIDIEVRRVNAVLQPAHARFVASVKNF